MAESKTRGSGATPGSDVDPALERADDATVIARVSTARQVGDEDQQGVEELLRRAADRHRAALDRLAKQTNFPAVVPSDVSYLNYEDFLRAAVQALGMNLDTVRRVANRPLAESALAAPAAGFGDHELYPDLAVKVAVLLQRVASNHALPDGNKRTALLCAVLFANVNGLDWEPPATDDPDGAETAEVVEAAAAGAVPLAALAAWVRDRLLDLPPPVPRGLSERPALVVYPAEYIGPLPYQDHTLQIGDLVVHDVHGYNPAGVYVRRISGKTEGITVAEVIISAVGDGYAQEELDAENAEAERYPLGTKEFWRTRLVGSATYGLDRHVMTNDEFEADWAESQQE